MNIKNIILKKYLKNRLKVMHSKQNKIKKWTTNF